jgi:peroxiredoxin
MRLFWVSLVVLAEIVHPTLSLAGEPTCGKSVPDFALPDCQGTVRKMSDWRDRELIVVVFLGVDCPLARLYAGRLEELASTFGPRGVAFVGIDSNRHDSIEAIERFGRDHRVSFPLLKDADATAADCFGATRTPEVFVLDRERVVRYRGRIDDQYSVEGRRGEPTRRDLAVAVEELLAGRRVEKSATPTSGCLIDRQPATSARTPVTFCRDIAPILQQRCQRCHRPGQVAPFPLLSYEDAAGWAEMIREVVRERRMPPWNANPSYGRFANDPSLTERERCLIDDWVEAGAPEGDAAELPPPVRFAEGWTIPEPDAVVAMPERFTVPAQGVLENQWFTVDPGFREDKWVRAAEIRPGNRKVVHHCTVYLQAPQVDEPVEQGALGSFCLAAMAPGTPPLLLPDGMAKKIPAGWKLVFDLHYTPIGSVQTDQTSIGLVFADPKLVRQEAATKVLRDDDLAIPPHARDHRVEHSHRFEEAAVLLAFFPHMHLRGKSFRYEAVYPGGTSEVLLDVPRYDFNWQHRYELAEPKRVPAGTFLRCVAHYDNSVDNPFNPDPNVTVRTGLQSTREMFNGYFEWALADQDLTQLPPLGVAIRDAIRRTFRPGFGLIVVAAGATFLVVNRYRRNRKISALDNSTVL